MKIYLGADHGGFKLKEEFKQYLLINHADLEIEDCGALVLEPTDDYSPIALVVAEKVAKTQELGILLCHATERHRRRAP